MVRHAATVLAALLLGVATARAQCPDGTPPPCVESGRSPTVVPALRGAAIPDSAARARAFGLMPFRNLTGKADHEWLSAGIPKMLEQYLGQFPDLTVVSTERQLDAMRRLRLSPTAAVGTAELRSLARLTGGWSVLRGSILPAGRGVQVQLEVVDAGSGRVLGRRVVGVASDAELAAAALALFRFALERVGDVAALPAELAGLMRPSAGDAATALADRAASTSSIEAFRLYTSVLPLVARGDDAGAVLQLRRAVGIDSTFASAWSMLSLLLAKGARCAGDAAALPGGDASRAFAMAERHASQLSPDERADLRARRARFGGQLALAREIRDSLWRADTAYVVRAGLLADAHWEDVVLRDSLRPERGPRGNANLALRLYERHAVELQEPREWLATHWAQLAGDLGFPARGIGAFPRERASLCDYRDEAAPVRLLPVVTDTVGWMPRDAWDRLSAGTRRAYRRRAAEQARDWAERAAQGRPDRGDLWFNLMLQQVNLRDYAGAEGSLTRAMAAGLGPVARAELPYFQAKVALGRGRYDDALRVATAGLTDTARARYVARHQVAALLALGRWDEAWGAAVTAAQRERRPPTCARLLELVAPSYGGSVPLVTRRAIMDSVARALPELLVRPGIGACAVDLATRLLPDSTELPRPEIAQLLGQRIAAQLATPGTVPDGVLLSQGRVLGDLDRAQYLALHALPRYHALDNEATLEWMVESDTMVVSGDSVRVSWRWTGPGSFRWDLPGQWDGWALHTTVRVGDGPDSPVLHFQLSRPPLPPTATATEQRGRLPELLAAATFAGAFTTVPLPALTPGAPRESQWHGSARMEGDRLVLVIRGALAERLRRARPAVHVHPGTCVGNVGGLCDRSSYPVAYR